MYSVSTESHMPNLNNLTSREQERGAVLIYDQYRYYHFLEKQDSHDTKSRKNINMGGQGSGRTSSQGSKSGQGGRGGGKSHMQQTIFDAGGATWDGNEKNSAVVTPTKSNDKRNDNETSNDDNQVGAASENSLTTPPQEKPMNQTQKKKEDSGAITTYKTRIGYRQMVKEGEVDVVLKMKAIMARLMQYEKSIQLLTYEPTDKTNPIIMAKDIPENEQDFEIFVPHSSVHPKSRMLHMCFRISAEKKLWKLKALPPIRNYLTKFAIYLDQKYIVTMDNAKVGGMILSNCQFTRRDDAIKDLFVRANENEESKIPLQLTPFVLYNGNGNRKISTKLLSVECSREHANELKTRLFTKLLNVPESMKYSNTKSFKFIPFNATGAITDRIIRSGMYLQNKYLAQCTNITLLRVHSLDWIVPNCGNASLKQLVLEAMQEKGLEKLFTGIEIGTSENKVHLLTTNNIRSEAETWVDNFVQQMKEVSTSTEFWKNETGFEEHPVRIDKQDASDAHKAYANYIDQSFTSIVGKEAEHNAPKSQPSRRSYSQVVFGTENTSQTSQITKSTRTSTLSSDSSAQKEVIGSAISKAVQKMNEDKKNNDSKTKNSLLDEMKKMNKDATSRLSKMEKENESFEIMMKELHENNKAKAQAMEQYEQRLTQISSNTANTSNKVDSIESKMDRSNMVMKQFIGVMAEVLGPNGGLGGNASNEQNLRNLANFLDEEEGAEEQLNNMFNTKKQKPSPDEDNDVVMGGEGSKK